MNSRINTNNPNNPLRFEVRRIQQQKDGRSLSIVIPNRYIHKLDLHKGDLLRASLDDTRLVFEKVDLDIGVA